MSNSTESNAQQRRTLNALLARATDPRECDDIEADLAALSPEATTAAAHHIEALTETPEQDNDNDNEESAADEPPPLPPQSSEKLPGVKPALEAINQDYIFVRSPVGVFHIPTRNLYTIENFKHLLENGFALDANKVIATAQAWLKSRDRTECAKLVYEPGKALWLPDGSFNLYRAPNIEPRKGDIGPWRKLLDHIFRNDNKARQWFERWVAYPLQRPGTKLFTAVVLWGVQGGGKSLLGETYGKLYGENYYEPSKSEFSNQFNEWLRFRQFVLVNESLSTGNRHDADELKAMITREYATINRKYQPQFQVRDCVNYLITSNHPDAVLVEDTERRYFVHRVAARLGSYLADEVSAFKKDPKGQAALLHYLLHDVDVRGFNPRAPAPETAARLDMIEATICDLDRFIRDEIEAARCGERSTRTTAERLKSQYENTYTTRTSIKAITVALQKFGAVYLGQKREGDRNVRGDNRKRVWRLVSKAHTE